MKEETKERSQRGQAVSDTRRRRRGGGNRLSKKSASSKAAKKSPKSKDRSSKPMAPEEFRELMDAIGKVINAAIGNLVGEFEELNLDKDVGGAAQLMGRGATLCVVAQVFDLLLAAMNKRRKIRLTRLATLSRILVDQRREERQSPSLKDGTTKSGEAHCNADKGQLNGLVQEVYGAASERDDQPAEESHSEPSSDSSATVAPEPAVGALSVGS